MTNDPIIESKSRKFKVFIFCFPPRWTVFDRRRGRLLQASDWVAEKRLHDHPGDILADVHVGMRC